MSGLPDFDVLTLDVGGLFVVPDHERFGAARCTSILGSLCDLDDHAHITSLLDLLG